MTKLVVGLPWPSYSLWPNAHKGWRSRYRSMKAARELAKFITLQTLAGQEFAPDAFAVPVTLTFTPPTRRSYDEDNAQAACKAYLDGLADALKVNDNRFRLTAHHAGFQSGGGVTFEIGE